MVDLTTDVLSKNFAPKPEKSEAQLRCEANGGKWDPVRGTCILPEPKVETPKPIPTEVPAQPTDQTLPAPEVFTDPKNKNLSGITLEDGRTFLGLSPDEVNEIAARETQRGVPPPGTFPVGTAAAQAKVTAEQERISAEERPERRELSPELSFGEKIPVLGGVIGATSDIIRPFKKKLGFKTTDPLAPEELRTLALSEIERIEIERGLTASETLGKFAEATGFSRLDVFGFSAKDLIETPSENAIEAKKNILKEKRRIANIETNVKLGYLPVGDAQIQIEDIEQNTQRLSSRIRLLVANSPELKFNSDFVNTMETEILLTEEKIFQGKQNILTGATQDPTEIEVFLKLKSLQDEDETK